MCYAQAGGGAFEEHRVQEAQVDSGQERYQVDPTQENCETQEEQSESHIMRMNLYKYAMCIHTL